MSSGELSAKRTLEEANEPQASKEKRTRFSFNGQYQYFNPQWKMWFLKNYTFTEGSMTLLNDIIELAEKEREFFGLSPRLLKPPLGCIVKDIWGEKVRRVRRGKHREASYLNVTPKQNQVRSSKYDLNFEFEDMAKDPLLELPNGWVKIVDYETKISLVRPESCEFENQRICTEITMELSLEKEVVCFIKSHGNKVNLRDLKFKTILKDLPVKVQAQIVLEFVESSTICLGCRFKEDAAIDVMESDRIGLFKSLHKPDVLPQKGAFSANCKLFASFGEQCSRCYYLN